MVSGREPEYQRKARPLAPLWQVPASPVGEIELADAGEYTLQVTADGIDAQAGEGLALAEIALSPASP